MADAEEAVREVDQSVAEAGRVRTRRAMVSPFARALSVLEAWTPEDTWLGNLELAQRTGLPTSTVTRMVQSLVQLGYLRHAPAERKGRSFAARRTASRYAPRCAPA